MKEKTEEIHVFQNQKQEDKWRKEWDYWRAIVLEELKKKGALKRGNIKHV